MTKDPKHPQERARTVRIAVAMAANDVHKIEDHQRALLLIPQGSILLTPEEAASIRNNYAGASRICHAKSEHVLRNPCLLSWDECTDADCVRDRENLALLGGGS